MAQNGVPSFHLNLSEITKSVTNQIDDDLPPIPTIDEVNNNKTIQPRRREELNIVRKSLMGNSDESSSDADIDDLVALPVGKAEEKEDKLEDNMQTVVQQITNLPDLDNNSDDEDMAGGASNFSILTDMMLTPEQFNEPQVEWTFAKFIKNFAKNENNIKGYDFDDEEEEDLMYDEEDYDDDDDDDDDDDY